MWRNGGTAERRNGKSKVALALLVISVVLTPVPASASITDSYGCTEYAAESGYEGAKEGLLTYYGTANAETWTYGHATGACRNISSVAVEAGLYQWRWTGSSFSYCGFDYTGILNGGYAHASHSCSPGGSGGDYVSGTHRVWITGTPYDSTGVLEGHI